MRFKIEEFETSSGSKKVRLQGEKLEERFDKVVDMSTFMEKDLSMYLINDKFIVRNTPKCKPVEIVDDKNVKYELLVTKNNREIEQIAEAVINSKVMVEGNQEVMAMQAGNLSKMLQDTATKIRQNIVTEEEKQAEIEKILETIQNKNIKFAEVAEVAENKGLI